MAEKQEQDLGFLSYPGPLTGNVGGRGGEREGVESIPSQLLKYLPHLFLPAFTHSVWGGKALFIITGSN